VPETNTEFVTFLQRRIAHFAVRAWYGLRRRASASVERFTLSGMLVLHLGDRRRLRRVVPAECWFSILQGQSLAGASFTSVEQLREHIDAFLEAYNKTAEPFVWIKSKVYQRRVKGRRLSDL
jgi:hypothetical protein